METLEESVHAFATWLNDTPLSMFLQAQGTFFYGALETLHLLGMALLLGTIGVFDLRVLGLAKTIPAAALHRLIPWGVAGFVLNLVTGVLFVTGHPHDYLFDPAFRTKMALILIAGLNVLLFYGTAFGELRTTAADGQFPLGSRVITGVSLTAWTGVLVCGALVGAGFFQ